MSKAKACMNSPKKKQEVRKIIDGVISGRIVIENMSGTRTPARAAEKFIEVLKDTINSSGLSAGAASAISELSHGDPVETGEFTYKIKVYFSGDLHRPSLDPGTYGGIDDLAELFDVGVDHHMQPVHGQWHGHETWSRTVILGAHFIEQAVSTFMGSYAAEYHVKNITINRSH